MLAIKINDPAIEKELADIAKKQHTSRQAVVLTMIARQLEDRADYRAAVIAKRRVESGKTMIIQSEELWGRLGLAD